MVDGVNKSMVKLNAHIMIYERIEWFLYDGFAYVPNIMLPGKAKRYPKSYITNPLTHYND